MISNKFEFVDQELDRRKNEHRFRRLKSVHPVSAVEIREYDRRMINFCANDYLGLSKNETLQKRAVQYLTTYGVGSTASRLVCGNFDIFDAVEQKIAALKETEAAMVFNSGYQANVSAISALADKNALILSDQLNHNSIISGARLARCAVRVYRHNDMDHLRRLLEKTAGNGFSRVLIVTESLFSMDGDLIDVNALSAIADEFGAILIVDDAHATGVMGRRGMGLTCGTGVDVVIGTFSKGCGVFGAYAACSQRVRDYLINCCPGFIYTTALPPPVIGAIDAALEMVPTMTLEREKLLNNADWLRRRLSAMGYNTGASASQIIPVIVGDAQKTLSLSAWLSEHGILATAIRPPTVPEGASRIRLSLSAAHTLQHFDQLLAALERWQEKLAG
ncbi:MAG: 8-amino-7-oxononanoate synthase [Thermodesulfobacteriota bacterium]